MNTQGTRIESRPKEKSPRDFSTAKESRRLYLHQRPSVGLSNVLQTCAEGEVAVFSNKRRKQMTEEQAEVYQQKAIRGLENLGLYDEADDVADLTPAQYTEQKGIEIVNPRRRTTNMASKQELEKQIRELEEENEELQSRLDEVLDIVAPSEDEEDEEDLGEEE